MAIVRIARGTAATKTLGNTLTIPDVTIDEHTSLFVGSACVGITSIESAKWGTFTLGLDGAADTAGMHIEVCSLQYLETVSGGTNDLVITYADSVGARAAFASQVSGVNERDITATASVGIAAPIEVNSGSLPLGQALGIIIATAGPVTDTPGMPVGGAPGQRAGTTGGNDVTIQEMYGLVFATGDQSYGRGTDSDQREHGLVLVSYVDNPFRTTNFEYLTELWNDFIGAAELVRDNGMYEVSIEDSADASFKETDFSTLILRKRPL